MAISIHHKATIEAGLCNWNHTQFCVMESTGNVVIVGKEKEDDQPALHFNKYKNGWQKIRTIPFPCRHSEWFFILPVMIENKECLLVSCWNCRIIWFCDIESGMFKKALREGFSPGLFCKAEGEYVFIQQCVRGSEDILKVKCSPTGLTVDKGKTVHCNMDTIHSMCYLPGVNCIAFSWWQDHVVKAKHCETSEEVWEVNGEVEGVTWDPHGLLYYPQHQSLLVCDTSDNSRLVVLNPSDGSVLQVIPLSVLNFPHDLYLHEGNIIVNNNIATGMQIGVLGID